MAGKKTTANGSPKKSTQLTEELAKVILERATQDGKIDQKDIVKEIPETPDNVDILDKLYNDLTEAGGDLTGVTEPNPENITDEWTDDEEIDEEEVMQDNSYIDDVSEDSVRLY